MTASPSSAFGTARDLRNRPQFRFGSEADSNAANWDVRLVPQADNVPGGLFFVIADTANLISNLDVQGSLLLVCTRARPPVSGLSYRSLGGILHNRFTERSTALALNVSQLFAPIPIRSVDWRTSPPIYLAVISKRVWP